MCIISYKPANEVIFNSKTIFNMFTNNPDGAGVMWSEGGQVHIKKGFMNYKSLQDFIDSRDWTTVPLFIHCRIGTSGGNTPLNTHPYPIYSKNAIETVCSAAYMHNGILYDYTPAKTSPINDSQIFKNKVLSQLPKNFINNNGIKELLEKAVGGNNRMAFLDGVGNTLFIGSWIKDGRYKFSNLSYKNTNIHSFSTIYGTHSFL